MTMRVAAKSDMVPGHATSAPVNCFPVKVLGFETSCDETGVALVEAVPGAPPRLLGEALHSQVALHAPFGGVVPELASRDHIRHILPLTRAVLEQAGCTRADIDVIAYTRGPGLAGALLVGAGVAVALGAALGKPTLGIHHLEGHLLSPFLAPPGAGPDARLQFPFVALLVSGGHTQLMRVEGVGNYRLMGETVDDAAGEAFDKSAKMLGLGYPGGPELARLAEAGNPRAYALPRPLLHSGDLDFSFAGLKTAVMTQLRKLGPDAGLSARADLAASAQAAIVEVLTAKALKALQLSGFKRLVVAGGVGANLQLRASLDAGAGARGARVHYPPLALCTDNGAMIALAAVLRLQHGMGQDRCDGAFNVRPRWALAELTGAVAGPRPIPG
jgi:N6-L-threonylcarbamoyladenine synthase